MEEALTFDEALYMIEKLQCGSDYLREALGRALDARDAAQLKLTKIKEQATAQTCVSYEYDPTPTAEERLKNIVKIINDA